MALVFGDSFDHYAIGDILKKWTSVAGSSSSSMDAANALAPHVQCLLLAGTSNPAYAKTLPATQETFIAGTWFRWTSGVATILQFLDGATEHVSVRIDVTGHITFTRNGTVLATSASALATLTWYHIEVKATIGDAADTPSGRYQVKVNGADWIADSGTGQDTRNAGNKSISVVSINAFTNRYQDFYILNTTGAVASDFIGPCRFAVLHPSGVGNSAQFTGNYADNFVNVGGMIQDGDATFNADSTAGHIDSFAFGDPPSGTIYGVQHNLTARQDAGPAHTLRPKTRIAATPYNGATVALSPSYVDILEANSVSPASGVAWTAAEIAAAEFGYELVS